jgi:SSS family transporter
VLLASIIFYLIGTILIGYWASRRVKTSGDFMLAGRSLPMMLTASALFATWFGSETVFGASAQFLEGGLYAVIEDPFGAALCLVLFGLFFARRLYNMNLITLGDYFKVRYGRRTELISSVFLAPPYVGYIAAQLVAMGLILNVVAGIDVWQGVVLSAVVVTFYTYIGGMWAISITDFVQSIIIIIGLVVLAIVLASKAGGAVNVLREVPAENLKFLPSLDGKEIIAWLAAWSVLGLGSVPSQDVFQRSMSSGSASTAVRSCYIAAILYLTVATLPLFISVCTKYLYPEQIGDPQLALPQMVIQHTSMVVQVLFFGSLLSAIMSTTSSAMLAPASILAENLIRPLSKKVFTDSEMLRLTRLCLLGFSIVATVMACLRENIYELVGESSILSLVSLFIPLTMGLYWSRANAQGAILAMLLGSVTWFACEWFDVGLPSLVPATFASLAGMLFGGWVFARQSATNA